MGATKTAIALALMCAVALGAGVVAGKLVTRQPPVEPPSPIVATGSPLTDELALTPQQREQMRQIWETVRDTADTCARQAQTAEKEQQAQLIGMLTDEQKTRYEQLTRNTKAKVDALNARRQKAFHEAVEHTKEILNPDQRRAYLQIVRNRIGAVPGDNDTAQPGAGSDTIH